MKAAGLRLLATLLLTSSLHLVRGTPETARGSPDLVWNPDQVLPEYRGTTGSDRSAERVKEVLRRWAVTGSIVTPCSNADSGCRDV